jgi:putative flippase GtrA
VRGDRSPHRLVVRFPAVPFVATLIAAVVAGLLAREALGLPLVAAMAIALVAGLAADALARRHMQR